MARTFFDRFGHLGVVVLPSETLCSEVQASQSPTGLVYAQILRPCGDVSIPGGSLYWVEVASTPDMFQSPTGCEETERVILTEEALYFSVPFDVRVQGKSPQDMLRIMEAHAQAVRPAERTFQSRCENSPQYDTVPLHPQEQPETTMLIPLPELFVSVQTVDETVAEAPEPLQNHIPAHPTAWARLVWLRAALAMVRRQMNHCRQAFNKLDILLDRVLSAQRHMRQSLVCASPVHVGGRLVGWRLQIALPMTEVLA